MLKPSSVCPLQTGGLADTVFDIDNDQERAEAAGTVTNGFSFDGTDTAALDYALNRSASLPLRSLSSSAS